jgi:hypothetical protein
MTLMMMSTPPAPPDNIDLPIAGVYEGQETILEGDEEADVDD